MRAIYNKNSENFKTEFRERKSMSFDRVLTLTLHMGVTT